MEFTKFFKLLNKYKYILMGVPVLTAVVAFFLVRNLPNEYTSQVEISTGLVDDSQQVLGEGNLQADKVNQQFSNLLETIRLPMILNQVSYSLIIHDLTDAHPFRAKEKVVEAFKNLDNVKALATFREKYQKRQSLNLSDAYERSLNEGLAKLGYDIESTRKHLSSYRIENSDYLHFEFTSSNPNLSAFVLNSLAKEFITYASVSFKQNREKANQFLGGMLKEKQDTMNSKIAALRNYKIANRILDLKDLSTSLYAQITDYKDKKLQSEKDIASYKSALRNINARFNPADRKYLESSSVKINGQISQNKERMKALGDKYIQSNFNPRYQKSIDSLQDIVSAQIESASDRFVANPLAGKESLVQEKLKLELELDMSQSSIRNLDNELGRLNSQLDRIVPFDAAIQSFERDIDIATKEYTDIQNKYNQSGIESNIDIKLRQLDTSMPGTLVPSKKLLLVAVSTIASFVFCLIALLVVFFLDKSVKGIQELANATQLPILGYLNMVNRSNVDYKRIGIDQQSAEELKVFKNLLRSIRFEIDTELNKSSDRADGKGKILAVTSVNDQEGKTLFSVSLASAYAVANQRVLLIDGNFGNPTISESAKDSNLFLEDFLTTDKIEIDTSNSNTVTIMCNSGGEKSILETGTQNNIKDKLNILRSQFDVIIIETPALAHLNKAKEWFLFVDKIAAVFEANQPITVTMQNQLNYLKSLDNQFIGLVMNRVLKNELLADPSKA